MSDVTAQKEPEKIADSAAGAAGAPVAGLSVSGAAGSADGKQAASGGEVVFNDNITISASSRLPHLDRGPVKAYAAIGSGGVSSRLFALICEDHLTPRLLKTPSYASVINPCLVPLVAAGPVFWSQAGREKFCYIFDNKLGNPLMRDDMHGGLGLKPDIAMNSVIKPLINTLADLRDKDIFHGNIRPSNLFDGGSKSMDRVILGDCLSLPPGYNQPVLYETIDRALVSPSARGTGTVQDDLYSFGVTLAVLLRHFNPLEGLSDDEIIERKMEDGSYVALLSRDRFSGAVLELLRGLLQDDEDQRWTLDEVLQWIEGRRLSPKQSVRRPKASRPLVFNGEKYIRPELLARDLCKHPNEARHLVENGEIEQWLSRALENKMTTARYETALKLAEDGGKGGGYTERLVARVSIALHPEGPIRFKNLSVLPDGVGASLFEAFVMRRDLQTYTDFFMNYFITQWVDSQSSSVPDVSSMVSRFDGTRAYLRQKGIGNGLERCIYAMNPEAPCLSEKLQKYYVRSPEDMMRAFEKLSSQAGRPAMFFDRHSIAFLLVKDRKNIDPYIHDLNATEPYRRILSEAKILATIQKRSQMERFPGIAKWMIENLGPVYERFHDRELRVEIKKKANVLQESGDLPKIVILFDNPSLYQEDNMNFRKSMRKYHDLEEEAVDTERRLVDEASFGRDTGHFVAALVGGALAALAALVAGFSALGGGG